MLGSSIDKARLDVSARAVGTPFDKIFLYIIRVSHPNCSSNRTKNLLEVYKENKNEKRDNYLSERILNMEKATFTPRVFLTSGGMYKKCTRLRNILTDLIATKKKERYYDTRPGI